MKNVKRFFALLFVVSIFMLVACTKTVEYYFAVDDYNEDSTWVSYVTVTRTGGKITGAHWSAFNIEGDTNTTYMGLDKYNASVQHIYDMRSDLWWHEQADLMVAKLIDTQSYNDQDPLPAGVSIVVDDFYALVEKALNNGPVQKGEYTDGYHFISLINDGEEEAGGSFYHAASDSVITVDPFNSYTFASVVVLNGRIVMVYFNASYAKFRLEMDDQNQFVTQTVGSDTYQVIASNHRVSGGVPRAYLTKNQLGLSYGMKRPNGPGQFEYYEAAKSAGDYVVENQGWLAELTGGKTDAVSGVTITATAFQTIANLIPKP